MGYVMRDLQQELREVYAESKKIASNYGGKAPLKGSRHYPRFEELRKQAVGIKEKMQESGCGLDYFRVTFGE